MLQRIRGKEFKKRLSQVIEEEIPHCKIAVLSGPSHAKKFLEEYLLLLGAAKEQWVSEFVQDVFRS